MFVRSTFRCVRCWPGHFVSILKSCAVFPAPAFWLLWVPQRKGQLRLLHAVVPADRVPVVDPHPVVAAYPDSQFHLPADRLNSSRRMLIYSILRKRTLVVSHPEYQGRHPAVLRRFSFTFCTFSRACGLQCSPIFRRRRFTHFNAGGVVKGVGNATIPREFNELAEPQTAVRVNHIAETACRRRSTFRRTVNFYDFPRTQGGL